MVSSREEDSGRPTAPLPFAVVVADALAGVLFVIGAIVAVFGSIRAYPFGLRISVAGPWRALLFAAVVVLLRHAFVPRRPIWARLMGDPARWGERQLFAAPGSGRGQRARELACIIAAFCLLVAIVTWPQVRHLDWVPDLGDPLFSVWRLAWVAHQLPRDPLHLFDANIFFPERLTFTYSDPVLVPALAGAPFFWLGLPGVGIYTVLLLSAFALSGVTMFLLVRALTGRKDAAAIAGVIFALYPYRFEHYHHLELQMTIWMPLVLWGLHRTMARGRLVDAIETGIGFALQMLSSLYYGLFLATYLIPLGAGLWFARRTPWRPVRQLIVGAALAGAIIAPVASQYMANRPVLGERRPQVIQSYSATAADYLTPHSRSWLYGQWSGGGRSERQLFPGVLPVVLSAVALWPPVSPVCLAYAAALAVAIDGSRGFNGTIYSWLHEHVGAFRGLRVPARFSMLVGLTLAVLAGYGAARLLERFPRWRLTLMGALLAAAIVEPWPRLVLEPVWPRAPGVYDALAQSPSSVLAEFPMEPHLDLSDTRYLYFSIFHWHRLVNGYSGYIPRSHEETLQRLDEFPDEAALSYLREIGVDAFTVHGPFYAADRFREITEILDQRRDLTLVSVVPWEGSESRLYRFR